MSETDETLEKEPNANLEIIEILRELSAKADAIEKSQTEGFKAVSEEFKAISERFNDVDAQFEAIRQGIVVNSVSFDRLKAEVLSLRADVKEMAEEIRRSSRETLV